MTCSRQVIKSLGRFAMRTVRLSGDYYMLEALNTIRQSVIESLPYANSINQLACPSDSHSHPRVRFDVFSRKH
jgi:hypothetical protein